VDDNPINLRLLKTYMEKLNFPDTTCAENGSVAFEAVRYSKESFDLIFMGKPTFLKLSSGYPPPPI
jgi:CheY-like chemotaxis protein